MKIVRALFLLVLVLTVNGKPTVEDDYDPNFADDQEYTSDAVDNFPNEDEDYETDEEDEKYQNEPPPIIETVGMNFYAKANETLQLPCSVTNGDRFVTMWKKDNNLIFQDKISFGDKQKFFRTNDSLVIRHVSESDTGEYTCIVLVNKEKDINVTHHVFLESEPKIKSLRAQNDSKQLQAGDTLILTCNASGYPAPTIKWFFKNISMDISGETLKIENIGHDGAGFYRCLADNKIGRPAHGSIHIEVMHKPVVRIEKLYEDGKLHELRCVVHAFPEARVNWKKDGLDVQSGGNIVTKQKNTHHKLIFKEITERDFGQYVCSATNNVGTNEKVVNINQLPEEPRLLPKPQHPSKTVELTWTVDSNSPIEESVVYYRKEEETEWQQEEAKVTESKTTLYTVTHKFIGLSHGRYVTKLKAKNLYGWSKFSEESNFVIEGHRQHHHHKKHRISFNEEDAVVNEAESHAVLSNESNIALKDQEGTVLVGSPSKSGSLVPTLAISLGAAVIVALA